MISETTEDHDEDSRYEVALLFLLNICGTFMTQMLFNGVMIKHISVINYEQE